MRTPLLPILLTLLATAGCATRDTQLGTTVQNNIVAQVVDLEPVYAGVPIEGGNAARTVDGVNRYTKGEVRPLFKEGIGKEAPN